MDNVRDSFEARGREASKRKENTCNGRFDKEFFSKYASMSALLRAI